MFDLHLGDCLEVMKTLPDNSVDTVITDPPAGIAFMGKDWDRDKGGRDAWIAWLSEVMSECLRLLKPGGMALVWSIPRTSHWTGMALEDAGFEIRDTVLHLFGSGFPKSHDIGKAIDKHGGNPNAWVAFSEAYAQLVKASKYTHSDIDKHLGIKSSSCYWARTDHRGGMPPRQHWEKVRRLLDIPAEFESIYLEAEREVLRTRHDAGKRGIAILGTEPKDYNITAPATPAAELWDGWGTALKPAAEVWWLAMKPLESTYAANALKHGVAGLWIDGGRIPANQVDIERAARPSPKFNSDTGMVYGFKTGEGRNGQTHDMSAGRWPANVIIGDAETARLLDEQSGERKGCTDNSIRDNPGTSWKNTSKQVNWTAYNDTGGASRFFLNLPDDEPTRFYYTSKASRRERNAGLEDMSNTHPTVKSVNLCRYLARLTKTPTGGVVLDPFAGSGSIGIGALLEGRSYIGIEMEPEYYAIAERRLQHALEQVKQSPPQLELPLDDAPKGRWPANVLLSPEVGEMLDEQSGERRSSKHINRSDSKNKRGDVQFSSGKGYAIPGVNTYSDDGGASRFFKSIPPDDLEATGD